MKCDEVNNREYASIILSKLRVKSQKILRGQMLHDLKVDAVNFYADDLLVSLRTFVMKEDLKEKIYEFNTMYPRSWWHMFKDAYFPNWLRNKFPIKYRTVKERVRFTAYEVYPQLPKVYDTGHHFAEICVEKL